MSAERNSERTAVALALILRSTDVELRGEHFVDTRLGQCWELLVSLQRAGTPLTLAELQARAKLTADEMVALAEACSLPATCRLGPDDFAVVARSISEAWLDRSVRDSVCSAMRDSGGREMLLSLMERLRAFDLGQGSDVVSIDRIVEQVWNEAVAARDGTATAKPRGVPTSIATLDDRLTYRGLPRGKLTVVGGATSAGKSALSNTFIRGASLAGLSTLVIPLEDDPAAVTTRILATTGQLQNRALQRREVDKMDWERFAEACAKVAGWRVQFMPRAMPAILLSQAIRAHCIRNEIDLCVIDYVQRVSAGRVTRSTQERVDFAMEQIDLAREACPRTAFVLVSQLHRTKGAVPTKEDLYHSGSIEQWADTIMLLWKPDVELSAPCLACIIDKQKNGPVGRLTFGWDAEHQCYSEPDEWAKKAFDAAVERCVK